MTLRNAPAEKETFAVPPDETAKYMNVKEAAEYLTKEVGQKVSASTLNRYRMVDKGPKFVRSFGMIYYSKKSLDDYAAQGDS